jgi:Na+/proline symporter
LNQTSAFESLLTPLDQGIIIAFLVLMLLVGTIFSKVAAQGLDDYFLGGQRIPWWVLGISAAASNFDISGTMIVVAVVFALGYQGFLVELRGGVGLSLAFMMIFLGKWLRRSQVMTSAEWMRIRFGSDRQGQLARQFSALANIVFAVGMITYFCKGAGKFLGTFLPWSELTCTALMVGVGLIYTLLSGLYGVVLTDLVQMILLAITAVMVISIGFQIRPGLDLPEHLFHLNLSSPAAAGQEMLLNSSGDWSVIFQFFGLCVGLWLFRVVLEGFGGIGGYTDQRFFAARNEKEASLVAFQSIVLSVLRWGMVAGLVILGYSLLGQGGTAADMIRADPEQVLPVVLAQTMPNGLRGLVVSGLIAAAMSTFDSTLNAGASFLVRDIYQAYIKPDASSKQLIVVSWLATLGLCGAGLGLAALVPSINQIWSLITMGLGGGLIIPSFLRWYWPRFNGYGYAAGVSVGIVAALIFDATLHWPLYLSFPSIVLCALTASIGVALITPATEAAVLTTFCAQVQPWGWWQPWRQQALAQGLVTEAEQDQQRKEQRQDQLSLFLAVPFQFSLLIAAMALVFHDWPRLLQFGLAAGILSVGLYRFWFRSLFPGTSADPSTSPTESTSPLP